jgi:predicted aconitase
MRFSEEEKRMLLGMEGPIEQRMMRLLVRLGEVFGAEGMVPVSSAQVSGISYKSIGEPGLAFLEDVAEKGARVRVPTTLNPAGMDLRDWKQMGVPEEFARRQERIIGAFERMGAEVSATCTPYLAGSQPWPGQHLAWAESSAVSFANSVLGARTNREGGPGALASAICGCTPSYGLHLAENRKPTVLIEVDVELDSRAAFGALGYFVGAKVENGIPYLRGIEQAGEDDLKTLGAAMAASGAVALYHVEGVTPESRSMSPDGLDVVRVGGKELDGTFARLGTEEKPDLVVLGCPHASLEEIADVARRLEGRTLGTPLWVCTSRAVKESACQLGLCDIIEKAGARVVADTCMVVSPIEQMGFRTTAVDSAKAAHYLPGFCGQGVVFGDVESLIEEALE